VLKELEETKKLYIVASGCVMLTTSVGDFDNFEICKLGPGSVINHRNVFIQSELFRFNMFATEPTVIYEITKQRL
jgi:CRP-like cAMP-binding protein